MTPLEIMHNQVLGEYLQKIVDQLVFFEEQTQTHPVKSVEPIVVVKSEAHQKWLQVIVKTINTPKRKET